MLMQLLQTPMEKKSTDTHVGATATDLVERSTDTCCCNRCRLRKKEEV